MKIISILLLFVVTIQLYAVVKQNRSMQKTIALQKEQIEALQKIDVLEKALPAVKSYCKDKGGDPFFFVSGSGAILNCANKDSTKLFLDLEGK